MVETIPNLTYGTVTGRFLAAVADSDADLDLNPDGVPLTGKVTFTPSVTALLLTSTTPPMTVLPAPIVATLDEQGYLSLNGVRGVNLIATDSMDTSPTEFTYDVSFQNVRYAGGPNLPYPSFGIFVPGGMVTDLTLTAPQPSSGGVPVVRDENAVWTAANSVAEALATIQSMSLVKTVNGVAPDGNGNVVVSGGGSKPTDGWTKADLAAAVQASLDKADSAVQRPANGFDTSYLAQGVIDSLGRADSAVQRPANGFDTSYLSPGVNNSLLKAENASQPGHKHASTDLTDATATGRSLIQATDAAAARTALGAPSRTETVRTVNGTAPDGNGNVVVSGGGGGVPTTRKIVGDGPYVVGGGDLSADRTLTLSDSAKQAVTTIGPYGRLPSAAVVQSEASADSFLEAGWYAIEYGFSTPDDNSRWMILVIADTYSNIEQHAYETGLSDPSTRRSMWRAYSSDGMWSEWAEVGGGSTGGGVQTVNGIAPDGSGNVTIPLGLPASTAAASQVYAKDTSGNPVGIQYVAQAATSNTLVQRDNNGRITVAAPGSSTDAATKGYVDAALLTAGDQGGTGFSTATGSTALTTFSAPTTRTLTLTGNVTLGNPPSGTTATAYTATLIIKQDATGGRTVTWPTNVKWHKGVKPTVSSAASSIDVYNFVWTGVEWLGFVGGQAFA